MNASNRTIVIVDDDEGRRTAFSRTLERVGYRPFATSSSPEVVELITSQQPAAAIIGDHQTGSGGVELINLIRERWCARDLPIVLIAGSNIVAGVETAMATGHTDVQHTRVDLADLVSTVRSVISSAQSIPVAAHGTRPWGR